MEPLGSDVTSSQLASVSSSLTFFKRYQSTALLKQRGFLGGDKWFNAVPRKLLMARMALICPQAFSSSAVADKVGGI